jgi:hypothetical protein
MARRLEFWEISSFSTPRRSDSSYIANRLALALPNAGQDLGGHEMGALSVRGTEMPSDGAGLQLLKFQSRA